MKNLVIEQADLFVVGPDVTRHRLAGDMGEIFETLTLLKLRTKCGLEGISGVTTYSEHCFDESLGAAIKPLLSEIIGQDATNADELHQHLMSRYNSMTPKPQSAINIALWDLKAKAESVPLYQLLGGTRQKIKSYASTPFFETTDEYIAFTKTLLEQGFETIKFHVWCNLQQDLQLLDALDEAFGKQFNFMIDLEERYTFEDALIIAKRLESMQCVWLEAPLVDTDLSGYAKLRQNTKVAILPAGNTLLAPELMTLGIEQKAWDALRTDVTYAGGFSGCKPIAQLAQTHKLPLELQSWGYTLTQAANLHLMLSTPNAAYFEQAVPYASHEALCHTPIQTQNGFVKAPTAAGLGIEMDWDKIRDQAIVHFHIGH